MESPLGDLGHVRRLSIQGDLVLAPTGRVVSVFRCVACVSECDYIVCVFVCECVNVYVSLRMTVCVYINS